MLRAPRRASGRRPRRRPSRAELSVRFLQAAHAAGRSAEHAKQSAQSGSAHVGEKAQGMGEARACGVGACIAAPSLTRIAAADHLAEGQRGGRVREGRGARGCQEDGHDRGQAVRHAAASSSARHRQRRPRQMLTRLHGFRGRTRRAMDAMCACGGLTALLRLSARAAAGRARPS